MINLSLIAWFGNSAPALLARDGLGSAVATLCGTSILSPVLVNYLLLTLLGEVLTCSVSGVPIKDVIQSVGADKGSMGRQRHSYNNRSHTHCWRDATHSSTTGWSCNDRFATATCN
jgi:hypothetical protein